MATIPIKNPYDPSGKSWRSLHKVSGQVSNEDYLFFKNLFPADGTINATIATLFKSLVDELRKRNDESRLETAWLLDSDTYSVLIALVQRRSPRSPVGTEGARDVPGRTGGLHKTHGDVAQQRAVAQSSAKKRRRKESE